MNRKTTTKRGRRLSFLTTPRFRGKNTKRYMSPAQPSYVAPTAVGVSALGEQTVAYDRRQQTKVRAADRANLERAAEKSSTPAAKLHKEHFVPPKGKNGKKVKTKEKNTAVLVAGFASRGAGTESHHYLPTKSLIEEKSDNLTFELAPFVIRDHGNRTKLRQYKKMYPRTNFLLTSPAQTVGGAEPGLVGQKFPLTSACGFSRTGLFNCFGYHDSVCNLSAPGEQLYRQHLTYKIGHGTKDDYTQIVNAMIDKCDFDAASGITDASSLLSRLLPYADGTSKFSLPITSLDTEYELSNKSAFMCTHIIIYMVTPRRILRQEQDPLASLFSPFAKKLDSTASEAELSQANRTLPQDMMYKPQVQANPSVAITGTQTSWNSLLWDQAPYVSTLATEIVPEASLNDSPTFRENWREIHKYRICLQPQQSVKFSIRSQINTMTDLFECLGYRPDYDTSAGDQGTSMWPDKTVFPIIRFWGDDTTATSIGLRRKKRPAGNATAPAMEKFMSERNKMMDQTQTGSASCQLNLTIKKSAGGHFPNLPINPDIAKALSGLPVGSSSPTSYAFMDCVQQRNKNYYSYDSIERGQNAPYFRVNSNIFDFIEESGSTQAYSGEQLTTVMELDTTSAGLTANTNWQISDLELGSTNDVNNIEIQTVTNQAIVQTGSTV